MFRLGVAMSQPSIPATTDRVYKIAIWFEGEQQFDLLPFIFFVTSANCAQQKFQFYFPDPPEGLTYKVAEARQKKRQPIFKTDSDEEVFYDVYVFITSDYMDGNLFFIEYGPLVHITTHGWQENFSPPSVFEYLFHSIMCGAMYALTTIHHHEDFNMGCQFEYTRIKELDRVDIALGFICQEHREMIRSELGDTALVDVENLFKFSWLGKSEEQGTISLPAKGLRL